MSKFTNLPMSEYEGASQVLSHIMLEEILRIGGNGSRMAQEIREARFAARLDGRDNEAACLEWAARIAEGKPIFPISDESKNAPDSSDN